MSAAAIIKYKHGGHEVYRMDPTGETMNMMVIGEHTVVKVYHERGVSFTKAEYIERHLDEKGPPLQNYIDRVLRENIVLEA